jgi:uncharacterized membrane protein YedE/YeeE
MNLLNFAWPFYWGGVGIGAVALLTFILKNKPLGASGAFDAVTAQFVNNAYYKHFKKDWRVLFFVGLLIGGFISFKAQHHWVLTWNFGLADVWVAPFSLKKIVVFLVGGFLIGFGTRWANGCTSGHAITGIALGGKHSFVATVVFFATAVVTTWAIYFLTGGF